MNKTQVNIILARKKFSKANESTKLAAIDVITKGITCAEAERIHDATTGTVSRYVKTIYSEYQFAMEVAKHD